MLRVPAFPNGPTLPVHPAWTDQVLASVTDPALRAALCRSDRLADRLVALLRARALGIDTSPGPTVPPERALVALAEHWGDPLFRRIGTLWAAPVLAPDLMNAKRATDGCRWTRTELQLILRYRDHASPRIVVHTDTAAEGAHCIAAWLRDASGAAISNLHLALPPAEGKANGTERARASLVARVLRDPEALAELSDDDA